MLTIIEALRAVGFGLPEGAYQVTLDSETRPTRADFDCLQPDGTGKHIARQVHVQLDEQAALLMVTAVQVHKVSHKLRTAK